MAKPTWRDHLRYRFENTLSKGPMAIIGWLALVSLTIVVLATLILSVLGIGSDPDQPDASYGPLESAWQSLMHAIDPGTLAGDAGWLLRLIMLLVTIGGIFIVSILIGTITSGLETRLTELRKGRSRVIETGHTLILGWSSKVHTIVSELVIANANQKKPRIVVLADRDKVEMDDEIRAQNPDTRNTRIICRRGSPLDLADLEVVAPHDARSVIVLSPENENPDAWVIKSVLALTNNPQRRSEPYHIVAEIRDEKNLEAAALVGGDEAIFIRTDDLIARVTAQTCRQSGLSVVYTELMDFDGAEIYFTPAGSLAGKTYRETIAAFRTSAVMGLMRNGDQALINPPMDTRVETGDQIIAISEDDDTLMADTSAARAPDAGAISVTKAAPSRPEHTLILGWNQRGKAIVAELENYVSAGSVTLVISESETARRELAAMAEGLSRQRLHAVAGEITSRAVLERCKITRFDHVIVLSEPALPIQEADARTLIALLNLRKIAEVDGRRLAIVSEMRDSKNRDLARVARADDFIVSDKLVSLMLSQLSENKQLDRVFKVLFSAEGSEIYIRPIEHYVKTGRDVDFYTLLEAAARRGETAIGYRLHAHAHDHDQGFGVRVNPDKAERVSFAPGDQLIVLAED